MITAPSKSPMIKKFIVFVAVVCLAKKELIRIITINNNINPEIQGNFLNFIFEESIAVFSY
jgi:hypothetical protein